MKVLQNGDAFPNIVVDAVGGGRISLPEDLGGSYGVVLIYRGSWCPYCNVQLSGFARTADSLAEIGIKVAAMSVDDGTTSTGLVERLGIRFPVGHSVNADSIAAVTGAYVNASPKFL